MKTNILTYLFLFLSGSLLAQIDTIHTIEEQDSLFTQETLDEAYSALRFKQWDDLSYQAVDSTLTVLNHLQLNEWTRDLYGQLSMANLASPLSYLVYQPDLNASSRSGYQTYFNGWGNAKDIRLYDVKAPLSGLRYLSGYDRGQLFGGYLTANPNERSNLFFDYERVSARGDYFSQDNLYDRVQGSGHYRTHNNKYSIQSALTWNKNRGNENGGITDNVGFDGSVPDSLITNRELVNVRWYNTEFKARQLQVVLSQQYLPFADSTEASGIGLYHYGDFELSNRTLTSTDSLIGNFYIDSAMTMDSSHFFSTDQQFGIVFQSGLKGFSYARVGAGYQHGELRNDSTSREQSGLYLAGELRGETSSFDWRAKGRYYIAGSQIGVFDLSGSIATEYKGFAVGANAIFQNQMPSLQSQEWYSNEFIWSNDFQTTFYQQLGGFIGLKDYARLDVKVHNWSRPIYYDQNALPNQISGAVQLVQSELFVKLPLTSWLVINSRTTLQLTSGSEDILRLPTLVNRSGIFGRWQIFGGALKAYTGLEATSFSKYQANAIMPITGVFYLQDSQEIGDFLYVNAIAGFKIASAEVYVLVENVGEGLFNRAYYAAPNYPLADRTIHLGFRWRFFN